jgi:hypothetical protein
MSTDCLSFGYSSRLQEHLSEMWLALQRINSRKRSTETLGMYLWHVGREF